MKSHLLILHGLPKRFRVSAEYKGLSSANSGPKALRTDERMFVVGETHDLARAIRIALYYTIPVNSVFSCLLYSIRISPIRIADLRRCFVSSRREEGGRNARVLIDFESEV